MEMTDARNAAVNNDFMLTRAHGNSMYPVIKNGDRVLVKKVLSSDLRRGDIILVRKDLWNICHRIIHLDRGKNIFYLRGDFNLSQCEKVEEKDILGKAVALVSQDKLRPLKFQNSLLCYITITPFIFLKEFSSFFIDKCYSFKFLRRLLKALTYNQIKCSLVQNEEEKELFYSLYNFLPRQLSYFRISEMILGFYRNKFVGKLWVLKDEGTGNFWLWGPYVKVLYRSRNIGSSLIKVAIDSLKNRNVENHIYALSPYNKPLIVCFKKLGFCLAEAKMGKEYRLLEKII